MRFHIYHSLVVSLTLTLAHAGHAAPIVAASHTFPPNGASYFNVGAGIGTDGSVFDNRQAQTFTADVGGLLDEVSFIATRLDGTNADLRVTVSTVADGQPDSVIATTQLEVDSFMEGFLSGHPDPFTSVADFSSQNISLAAQSQYAIVFSSDTVEANYRIYGDRSGYSGGANIRSQNGSSFESSTLPSDLFFQVTVDAIPEPSAGILAGLGALTLLLSISGLTRRCS